MKSLNTRFTNLAILFAFPLLFSMLNAEDFQRFKIDQFEGWVEETDLGGRVKLLPFVEMPGSAQFWRKDEFGNFGIGVTTSGKIQFGYKIISQDNQIPNGLTDSLAINLKRNREKFETYPVSFVNARIEKVELVIDGVVYATDNFNNSMIGGSQTGFFTIGLDESTVVNSLEEGNFYLRLRYTFPFSSYSSVRLRYDSEMLTRTWVRATKKIIESKSRSGFTFGPIDFSSEIRNSYVSEQVRKGGTASHSDNYSVVMVDPTPEQVDRFDKILGLFKTTASEVRTRHEIAHAAALASGNQTLAEAHLIYAKTLQLPGEKQGGFQEALLRHLEKLKDADIMSFYLAGFKSGTASASGYYRYNGSFDATTSTKAKLQFSDYLIKNTLIQMNTQSLPRVYEGRFYGLRGAFLDYDNRLFGLHQNKGILTPPFWAAGVAKAIEQNRIADVRYALSRRFTRSSVAEVDLNFPLNNGDTILHKAVLARNEDIVRLILRTGGDPNRKNRYGESSLDIAQDLGYDSIYSTLNSVKNESAKLTIQLNHKKIQIGNFKLYNPNNLRHHEISYPALDTTEITIEDFPMTLQLSFGFEYMVTVPSNSLQSFKFPYNIIQNQNNNTTISGQASLMLFENFDDGDDTVRIVNLEWSGPNWGWTTDAKNILSTNPPPANEPFSFDFSK